MEQSVLRPTAEQRYKEELEALKAWDAGNEKPANWQLSPKAVRLFILGTSKGEHIQAGEEPLTVKKKYFGNAALENAAKQLSMSPEELADRIVPTLGFSKDGSRVFDYGARSFTVRITPALELLITTGEGKAVKNMPAPGKTDDAEKSAAAYADFKAMKKLMKDTVSSQRFRLETARMVGRCWSISGWRELFVENSVMHQFAISLIWGIYEKGALTDTFRYMEDGSFNTADEEEYELPQEGNIGLVHPVELSEEELLAWKLRQEKC